MVRKLQSQSIETSLDSYMYIIDFSFKSLFDDDDVCVKKWLSE